MHGREAKIARWSIYPRNLFTLEEIRLNCKETYSARGERLHVDGIDGNSEELLLAF